MIHIDRQMIEPLIDKAREIPRKRKNYNFHPEPTDRVHRMLHAMEPDTYVQPHKHENPDKIEAFVILKGRVAAIEFNDQGEITDWMMMDPTTGNFGMEIPPRHWHSLICLEPGSVIYEVKDGPWDPADDKFFAPWAPAEGAPECRDYNQVILQKIGVTS